MTKPTAAKYQAALASLPASGGGGAHAALLGVANLGAFARIDEEQVFQDLRSAVHGSRPISDSEIRAAVSKAFNDAKSFRRKGWIRRPRPAIRGADALTAIIRRGDGATEADLFSASPIRIDWPPDEDSWRLLSLLYQPDEFLFIGDDTSPGILNATIRTAATWIEYFQKRNKCPYPKCIPNPLSGKVGMTKNGKPSLRADSCVAAFRFVVCEFDGISLEDQFAFWAGCPRLPVAAIIHSGKKSLHAWVRVDCANAQVWFQEVERRLFPEVLKPLGLDSTCQNEARLSRMPGHVRVDTELPQRLLYLAPEGKAVLS